MCSFDKNILIKIMNNFCDIPFVCTHWYCKIISEEMEGKIFKEINGRHSYHSLTGRIKTTNFMEHIAANSSTQTQKGLIKSYKKSGVILNAFLHQLVRCHSCQWTVNHA